MKSWPGPLRNSMSRLFDLLKIFFLPYQGPQGASGVKGVFGPMGDPGEPVSKKIPDLKNENTR